MDSALAALLGATIGGILSVVASWIAQRVQSKSQWLVQEIKQRQQLYGEFVKAAANCFADALQENEPDAGRLANLYGEIGQMRVYSTQRVVSEAYAIVRAILETHQDDNRSREEIRDLLNSGSVDLFSKFGDACRAELAQLRSQGPGMLGHFVPVKRAETTGS